MEKVYPVKNDPEVKILFLKDVFEAFGGEQSLSSLL